MLCVLYICIYNHYLTFTSTIGKIKFQIITFYLMINICVLLFVSGINTERLGVQFLEAREAFQAIETQNAQTMDVSCNHLLLQMPFVIF